MIGHFSAGSPARGGGGFRGVGKNRRKIAFVGAFLLFFATLFPAASGSIAGNTATDARSFEQRATAEQTSRSRFRRLEVASLVLILICGGAVTLWAIRRK